MTLGLNPDRLSPMSDVRKRPCSGPVYQNQCHQKNRQAADQIRKHEPMAAGVLAAAEFEAATSALPLINDPVFHHEGNARQYTHVLERVAVHGNQVGQLPDFNRA